MAKKKKNKTNNNSNNINKNKQKTVKEKEINKIEDKEVKEETVEDKTYNDNKKKIVEEINESKDYQDNEEEIVEDKEIEEDKNEKRIIEENKVNKTKESKNIWTNFLLIVLIIISLIHFVIILLDSDSSINDLINNLIITLFSIMFSVVGITYKRKNKKLLFLSGFTLLCYFALNLNNTFNIVKSPISVVPDFSNKSLTTVMKWASKNDILVNQDYEYSDMIQEYRVISQSVDSGKSLNGLKEIDISVSDGPNPYKEIIVPSMIGWDTDRVINFVKDNYLDNVIVEFIKSDKPVDTVIEQSTSGNLKRNEELRLKFSYGEELGYDEFTLIDFTNKSKFEIEFFMKQHQLKYEFENVFSSKIKKGYGIIQNIEPGKKIKVNDTLVKISISKGPKIVVPDLTKMSVNEITEWAIKNKLKLEFNDSYDDSIKEGNIIKTDKNTNDVLEQGNVVKVTLSRGKLKMPKFKSMSDFREWADKYGINYEEKHEFNDKYEVGEIISFSYDTGDTIKNGDSIVVTISDGKKIEVPSVTGLSKSNAISKLEKAGLNYNISYKYSNSVTKDKVISQSISAGSQVGAGTTVSLIISNGKKPAGGNSGGSSSGNNPSVKPSPTPVCEDVILYLDNSFINYNDPSVTCNNVKTAYPKLKINCDYVADPGLKNGMISNAPSIDGGTFSTCSTITLKIVRN